LPINAPEASDSRIGRGGQHLACGVKINTPHEPRFANAEGGFKQLVLHARAFASMLNAAPCRHPAWLDCPVL